MSPALPDFNRGNEKPAPHSVFKPVVPVGNGLFGIVAGADGFQLFEWHTEFAVHPLGGHELLAERQLRRRHPDHAHRLAFLQG